MAELRRVPKCNEVSLSCSTGSSFCRSVSPKMVSNVRVRSTCAAEAIVTAIMMHAIGPQPEPWSTLLQWRTTKGLRTKGLQHVCG